jgi:hypothetical protein
MVKYNDILKRIRRRKTTAVFKQESAMAHKANFSTSLNIFDTIHCMQWDIIHITKPVICTYKTHTMKQYPLLHILQGESHILGATMIFKTSQNTTHL